MSTPSTNLIAVRHRKSKLSLDSTIYPTTDVSPTTESEVFDSALELEAAISSNENKTVANVISPGTFSL